MTTIQYQEFATQIKQGNYYVLENIILKNRDWCLKRLLYRYPQYKIEDAEECFLTAIHELHRSIYQNKFEYKNKESMRAFLLAVSRNQLLKRKVNNHYNIDEIQEQLWFNNDNNMEAEKNHKFTVMKKALESLCQKCVQILKLKHYGGATHKEIAKEMSIASEKSSSAFYKKCFRKWQEQCLKLYKTIQPI